MRDGKQLAVKLDAPAPMQAAEQNGGILVNQCIDRGWEVVVV